jgi:lipoprotein
MMKKILLLLLLAVSFAACKKSENEPTLKVTFKCVSSNNYVLTFNSEEFLMGSKEVKQFDLIQGKTYKWSIKQSTGYALYPTTDSGEFVATKNMYIEFPRD